MRVGSVGRDLGRLFERALVVLAIVAAAWLVLVAVAHLADRAFITYQAGSRMGLALYTREGSLYPPLFDQGFYGGTRMMPIPILLHAGLSLVTGEFLASWKLLTYLSSGSARRRLRGDAGLGLFRCPIGGALGRGHGVGGRDMDFTHGLV